LQGRLLSQPAAAAHVHQQPRVQRYLARYILLHMQLAAAAGVAVGTLRLLLLLLRCHYAVLHHQAGHMHP
jgi:hypothetical protein